MKTRRSFSLLLVLSLLASTVALAWTTLDPEPKDPRKQSTFEYYWAVIDSKDKIWAERCYDSYGELINGRHKLRVTYTDSHGTPYDETVTVEFEDGDQVAGAPFIPKHGPIKSVDKVEVD